MRLSILIVLALFTVSSHAIAQQGLEGFQELTRSIHTQMAIQGGHHDFKIRIGAFGKPKKIKNSYSLTGLANINHHQPQNLPAFQDFGGLGQHQGLDNNQQLQQLQQYLALQGQGRRRPQRNFAAPNVSQFNMQLSLSQRQRQNYGEFDGLNLNWQRRRSPYIQSGGSPYTICGPNGCYQIGR